jgi:dihydroorotate dehydrogenase (fumarate)
MKLSSPGEFHLPLRWIGLAAGNLECDVAASTGVHDSESIVKALMMGASVTYVCTALYKNGPEYIRELRNNLNSWLDDEDFKSVGDIKGLALKKTEDEGKLLTRLQYVLALEEASKYYKF